MKLGDHITFVLLAFMTLVFGQILSHRNTYLCSCSGDVLVSTVSMCVEEDHPHNNPVNAHELLQNDQEAVSLYRSVAIPSIPWLNLPTLTFVSESLVWSKQAMFQTWEIDDPNYRLNQLLHRIESIVLRI